MTTASSPPLEEQGPTRAGARDGDGARPDRPLRVGLVVDGLEEGVSAEGRRYVKSGGVGVYIRNLVQALLAADPRCTLVPIRCGEGRLAVYEHPRVEPVFLPRTPVRRLTRWIDLPYRSVVRRLQLDLVHHPDQFGGFCLPRSIPEVVTLHDLSPLLHPELHRKRTVLRFRVLLRVSLARARAVITGSEATRRELVLRGLSAPDRTFSVPPAAAPAFRPDAGTAGAPARPRLPERYVLFVGMLEPRKNVPVLCEAVRRLRSRHPDLGLVLVGRPGWRWRDPRRDLGAAGEDAWLRILPDVADEELPALYRGAAALAYPSRHGGFGLPVLEAMSSGTPVVSSRTPVLEELTGGAALLTEPGNTDALAAAIASVLDDAPTRDRLVSAGLRRAAAFDWERTARRTLEVYRLAARA